MYKIIGKDKSSNVVIYLDKISDFEDAEDIVRNFYSKYDEDEIEVFELAIYSGYYTWIYAREDNSLKFKLVEKKIV